MVFVELFFSNYFSLEPNGTKKLLDVSILNKLGFKAKIDLKDGVEMVYGGYRK